MLTVAHLTSAHPAFDTRIFYKECQTLRDAGIAVYLLAPVQRDAIVNGIHILGTSFYAKSRLTRMSRLATQIVLRAASLDADIYHIHDPELIIPSYLYLVALRRKLVIFDMHENLPKAILNKSWVPRLLRTPLSRISHTAERLLLRKMPVVFAEASYRKDYSWISKACLAQNFPNLALLEQSATDKFPQYTVGYLGVVDETRCITELVLALAELQKDGHFIACKCIGPFEQSFRDSLLSLCKSHSVRDFVLLGYQQPAHAYTILSQCHAGVALLKDIPNAYESYPTKLFEYMALGLPVVASNFPLYQQVIDSARCGIPVRPDDHKEIAYAILRLLENPEEAIALGQRGQQAVRTTYNWETEGARLVEFYHQVHSTHRNKVLSLDAPV